MVSEARNEKAKADTARPSESGTKGDIRSDAIYLGLSWSEGRGVRPLLIGVSKITPMHYVVDMSMAPESFTLLQTFRQERERREHGKTGQKEGSSPIPQAEIARFPSAEEAMHAAELDDYRFFKRMKLAGGQTPLFEGSERVKAWRDKNDALLAENGEAMDPEEAAFDALLASSASYFTASKAAAKQNSDGSKQLTFKVEARALPLWLDHAPMGETIMLAAIDTGHNSETGDAQHEKRVKDAIKQSHLLVKEANFQQWLVRYDHWGLIATASRFNSRTVEEAVDETLRRIAGIFSRSEFRTNRDALEVFEALRREYYRDLSQDFHKAVRAAAS